MRRADGVKSLYQMIKIREQRRDGRRRVLERRDRLVRARHVFGFGSELRLPGWLCQSKHLGERHI